MAGIVAQITKANWERLQKRAKYLPPDKSAYSIPPFDTTFQPEVHNIYTKRKLAFENMHKEDEKSRKLREAMEELARVREEEKRRFPEPVAVRVGRAVFGASVLAFPTALLVFLLVTFWSV